MVVSEAPRSVRMSERGGVWTIVTLLEEGSGARILSMVWLEELARLSAASRQLRSLLGELGAGTTRSALRCMTRRRNVSPLFRVRWWNYMLGVDAARKAMLAKNKGGGGGFFETCAGLHRQGQSRGGVERLDLRGIEGEIRRDVGRTFATRDLFAKHHGQDLLADVLLAVATAHPQTGYCQGMNLVAGALLELHVRGGDIPAEGDDSRENSPLTSRSAQRAVFWLLSALCERGQLRALDNGLELRELWRPGMPQLKLRVYQLDKLLSKHAPKARSHLRSIGLAPDVLASQWFFTLFAYAVPPDWLPRIWDLVFADGWKALMRLALARIVLATPDLLAAGLEDAGKHLRDRTRLVDQARARHATKEPVEVFVDVAFEFKVTRTTLAELTEQFGLALLEERCRDDADGTDESWLNRYGGGDDLLADAPARALRSRLAELDETTRRDAAALRARVERVERDGADARVRLQKATEALREKRRLAGELVDAKRLAANEAARLIVQLSEEDMPGDAMPWTTPRKPKQRLFYRLLVPGSPRRFRPPVPFAASCLAPADDRTLIREELRATQLRAAKAEKDLRAARDKLSITARDFLLAQADLDEAHERKHAVETQLMHVVSNASARRRGVFAEVVEGADTPDLQLVKRFSQNRRSVSIQRSSLFNTSKKPAPPQSRRVQSDVLS